MKRKVFNVILVLVLFSFIVIPIKSLAVDLDLDKLTNSNTYNGSSSSSGIQDGLDETEKISSRLISNFIVLFRVVGLGIAIIILMSLAAKFIWGSIEQKVEVKKHLINYVVGAGVFFTASILLGMLQDFILANLK